MIEVNYERRGSGSPLVLLHGIGHRWQAWLPVLDRLAEHHDVIALDLPGFGRSAPLPTGTGHDLVSSMAIVSTVFSQLGVAGAHLAGNSLGGLLAVEAAVRGMVASATALSPAGFWSWVDRARAMATLRLIRAGALAPKPASDALLGNDMLRIGGGRLIYAHPERIDRRTALDDRDALRSASSFAPTLRTGRRFSWFGPAPTVPLTIAWGQLDRILPPPTGPARRPAAADGAPRDTARLRACPDDRRPGAGRPHHPGHLRPRHRLNRSRHARIASTGVEQFES